LIDRVLLNVEDEALIAATAREVREYMEKFPLYPELG
jgi:glycine hydroxymethyltransferase